MKRSLKRLIGISALTALMAATPAAAYAATYTVQPNDTLWKIGVKHGVTTDQLKQMNGLSSDMLLVGQKLQVPDPAHYSTAFVQSGDTMWKIAARYGIPLAKLIAANPQIPNPNVIWTGQELRIPTKPSTYLNGAFPLDQGTYQPYSNNYAEARDWSPNGAAARSHEGVDLFAAEGTPVYSVLDGTVVKAGWNEYGGWRITVRVDDNTEFYYAHLSRFAAGIKEGTTVAAGRLIGYVGSTGYGPEGTSGKFTSHLHFGMYKRTPTYRAVDPYLFLKWWEL